MSDQSSTPSKSLRDQMAEALIARIKQATIPDSSVPSFGGSVGHLLAATEYDLADVAMGLVAPELGELLFVRQVMSIFARADVRTEMFWNVYGDGIKLYANVSDVFTWGCADCEDITPERLPVLQCAYDDLAVIGALECLAELYGARIRGMRPQGAAYPDDPAARALFDACGPERQVGLGNPKAPPALAEPTQQGDGRG
jgi:hypothetical protein